VAVTAPDRDGHPLAANDVVVVAVRVSILARYEPATWVSMLNLDFDPYAVAIENALNEGLTTVPHLVRDAVLGESLLLP
jgi:hypothetical protein